MKESDVVQTEVANSICGSNSREARRQGGRSKENQFGFTSNLQRLRQRPKETTDKVAQSGCLPLPLPLPQLLATVWGSSIQRPHLFRWLRICVAATATATQQKVINF